MTDAGKIERLLSGERADAVAEAMRLAAEEPTYIYPWSSLEDDLASRGRDRLAVVGYGSLVNRDSAIITLDEGTVAASLSVIAFGVQRVFDYEMPPKVDRYGPEVLTEARAALNVRGTGRPDHTLNGVLFETRREEIQPFRMREVGYDLIPVACLDWEALDGSFFNAYVLECPDEPREGKVRTSRKISPHLYYYDVCRNGALDRGEDFLEYWLRTTYLADGVTRALDWEGEVG